MKMLEVGEAAQISNSIVYVCKGLKNEILQDE